MNLIRRFLKDYNHSVVAVLLASIFLSLFFTGHAVESILVIALVAFSLILLTFRVYSFSFNRPFQWLVILYYLFILLTGFWAIDKGLFVQKALMKSILIGIPVVFVIYSELPHKYFKYITMAITLGILVSSVFLLFNYNKNFEEILANLLRGQAIPVPFRSHIRYTILVNLVLLLGLHRVNIAAKRMGSPQFILWSLLVVYLFIFIQFLAVKTGIVMSFIILICFSFHKILQSREYMIGITILVSFCLFSVLILGKLPTVKNKLSYFKYDIQQYKKNNPKNYSDGERIVTIRQGLAVVKEHWVKGVGEGNIAHYLPSPTHSTDVKLPHNQFVIILAQNGIIGFMIFVLAMLTVLIRSVVSKNWLLFTYSVCLIFALMVEPMLETQIGLALFIIPLCMFSSLRKVYLR